MSALLADLQAKGLLGQTVIVLGTEFDRSPRINDDDRRDQLTCLLAGDGIGGGRWMGRWSGRVTWFSRHLTLRDSILPHLTTFYYYALQTSYYDAYLQLPSP